MGSMPIAVHAEAGRRADELILRALDAAADKPSPTIRSGSRYSPELPIERTITADDIQGPITSSQSDRFGRVISVACADKRGAVELTGLAYADFARAVEIIHGQRTVGERVSHEAVSECALRWLFETRVSGPGEPFLQFVVSHLESLVGEYDIVLPIYGLHIEAPLNCGIVTIADVSVAEIAAWGTKWASHPEAESPGALAVFERLRKEYQGRAAARLRVVGERGHAVARAKEAAELAVAVLRLASPGAYLPEVPSTLALYGKEVVAREHVLVVGSDDELSPYEGICYPDEMRPLYWDASHVTQHVLPLVNHWFTLLAKSGRTEFEDAALRSMLIYSRAIKHRNVSEKLIHCFAALESLLLRNENEPISTTVGDRLAFAVGRSPGDRLRIVRTLRAVYSMRSKYVHHALETAPDGEALEALELFLVNTSQFFVNVGGWFDKFTTPTQLIDALERRKYA